MASCMRGQAVSSITDMSDPIVSIEPHIECIEAHQLFGDCGVRWRVMRHSAPRTSAQERKIGLLVESVPRHARSAYGEFTREALTLEVPLKEVQGLALVLLGQLPEHEVRLLNPGAVVHSLLVRHQPQEKAPFFLSMRHAQTEHATAFGGDDAFHMSMVIQTLLQALYPRIPPEIIRQNFLHTAAIAFNA